MRSAAGPLPDAGRPGQGRGQATLHRMRSAAKIRSGVPARASTRVEDAVEGPGTRREQAPARPEGCRPGVRVGAWTRSGHARACSGTEMHARGPPARGVDPLRVPPRGSRARVGSRPGSGQGMLRTSPFAGEMARGHAARESFRGRDGLRACGARVTSRAESPEAMPRASHMACGKPRGHAVRGSHHVREGPRPCRTRVASRARKRPTAGATLVAALQDVPSQAALPATSHPCGLRLHGTCRERRHPCTRFTSVDCTN
jgi:hypothetical protein